MVDELDIEFTYLASNKPVTLSVIIGDAQIGGSVVKVNGDVVGKPGAIKKLALGKGIDLVDAEVEVKTLVSDINDDTNQTSVTYLLEGAEPAKVTAKRTVENNGDGVLYRAKLTFETE